MSFRSLLMNLFLCLIWEQIVILYTGSLDDRSDVAASLVSLARDNDRYGKLIIEEGGVNPLLKLVKEGKPGGQEKAAFAIGLLDRDPESIEHMIHAGVCSVFVKILKEVEEHSKYAITSNKPTSIHAVILASNNTNGSSNNNNSNGVLHHNPSNKSTNEDEDKIRVPHPSGNNNQPFKMHSVVATTMGMKDGQKPSNLNPNHNQKTENITIKKQNIHHNSSLSLSLHKGRESEDPATKAYMKSMAAKALWHLAKENSTICRSITESRALLCFAVLLEKGPEEVRYNSAMALMEITDSNSKLLLPCIQSIGNLARAFRATESRIIQPLVQLLEEREAEISKEATIALAKFTCKENYLHLDHSKAIITTGETRHLIQLVYFGEQMVQIPALVLLCYIAFHVPDSEDLAQAEVLTVLEWASEQSQLIQIERVENLLQESKGRLELFPSVLLKLISRFRFRKENQMLLVILMFSLMVMIQLC
ncbi:unnamed protein product [Lactuca virosa]|uniref:Uncharacterized protein n=1 Tax=Lactuca virosa TaxID=75947 RepID=A0AAU9MLM8_9ASTR|nr:unnamed protein product [Lactuca virosa]